MSVANLRPTGILSHSQGAGISFEQQHCNRMRQPARMSFSAPTWSTALLRSICR